MLMHIAYDKPAHCRYCGRVPRERIDFRRAKAVRRNLQDQVQSGDLSLLFSLLFRRFALAAGPFPCMPLAT
jgi:hypothetical protein